MSEPTIEGLQQQLKDSKTALEKAKEGTLSKEHQDRLSFLEDEQKKLIAARDKAKDDKRKADEKHLLEQGEFKTLAEQRKQELDDMAKGSDELKAKITEYQARDEKELAALTEKVPEEFKDDVADATLPIETRLSLARKLVGAKEKLAGYRPPGEPPAETLQARLAAAVKSGNIMEQLALKREIGVKT
jgi:uncharacterized phage infection (PIP) family protein YhgE